MRIDSITTHTCDSWSFVRVATDTGVVGVGESTVFGWPDAVATVAESFRPYLEGADPLQVEHHWNWMYRNRSMRGQVIVGAISAIDQALWDIRGKHYDAPVWQLLGGQVRDRVRAMLCVLPASMDDFVASSIEGVKEGYNALKLIPFGHDDHQLNYAAKVEEIVSRVRAVREAVGWDVDLGVELHRNLAPGETLQVCQELASSRPLFVEDPIAPDSVLALGRLASQAPVPLAAGERNTTLWEFGEVVDAAGVSYIRPDVGSAGGPTHVRKICAVAEARHLGVLPHAFPSGPVATAAHVQVGACTPNWVAQEHMPQERSPWTDVVDAVAPIVDGYFQVPEKPGLGIALDVDAVDARPVTAKPSRTPLRTDGSVALQ